jgi:hypothetical protein
MMDSNTDQGSAWGEIWSWILLIRFRIATRVYENQRKGIFKAVASDVAIFISPQHGLGVCPVFILQLTSTRQFLVLTASYGDLGKRAIGYSTGRLHVPRMERYVYFAR